MENWIESLEIKKKKKKLDFYFFEQLVNTNRYEIEQNTKLLITLRWNLNTIILIVCLF